MQEAQSPVRIQIQRRLRWQDSMVDLDVDHVKRDGFRSRQAPRAAASMP
jgi:hypothetical protein